MTAFVTKDFVDLFNETDEQIDLLNAGTTVDAIGGERDGKIKIQVRDNPRKVGWVALNQLEGGLAAVAPELEITRFVEAARDAANAVNRAFPDDGIDVSFELLLIWAWLESDWKNAGDQLPVATGTQPDTRFGPFGFRPGPWAATISDAKYAEILRDTTACSRIDPYLQCSVAACRINELQSSLVAATGRAPSSILIRIADLIGAEEVRRFTQLASDDPVDQVVDGKPALSGPTIAAHGDLFIRRGTVRTRGEVEATIEAQLTEAATAAAKKLAALDGTTGRQLGAVFRRSVMVFPLRRRPAEDYHTGGRRFRADRDNGLRKHAACDLIAAPGTEILAMADGVVIRGPSKFYLGTFALEVRHDDGMVLRYGEIKETLPPGVTLGARVTRGQVIAAVGRLTSGSSMLHLEMYRGTETGSLTQAGNEFGRRGDLTDPTPYLDQAVLISELPRELDQAPPVTAMPQVNSGDRTEVDRWVAALRAAETNGASMATAAPDHLAPGTEASRTMAEADLPNVRQIADRFAHVAGKFGMPAAVLAAIASRESRCGKVLRHDGWGKDGNAFGIMQVDKNSHSPAGIPDPISDDHIKQAAGIVDDYLGKIMRKHRDWADVHVLKGAVAAYNVGVANVQTITDMDDGTTHNDYSSDVLTRAKHYLDHPDLSAFRI